MATYRRKRTYYRRRRVRRSAKRRAIGNYRAALQQKDATQVNLSVTNQISACFKTIQLKGETEQIGVYALNIWDALRKSAFYTAYSIMYDQIHINSIRAKITPTSWAFNTGNDAFSALTIVTAWDRTGLSSEQWEFVKAYYDNQSPKPDVIGSTAQGDADGIYCTIGNEISSYSSAVTKNLNPGSSFSMTRYLYPSNIAEKSYYVNCRELEHWNTGYDIQNGRYIGLPADSFNASSLDETLRNPTFIAEDGSVPFKPTLLVGILGPNSGQIIDTTNYLIDSKPVGPVTFNIELDIGVTFRGLRKTTVQV